MRPNGGGDALGAAVRAQRAAGEGGQAGYGLLLNW
jgi:hypothetical protein